MRARMSASHARGSTPFSLRVYADRRTMPNGSVFPSIHRDLHLVVRRGRRHGRRRESNGHKSRIRYGLISLKRLDPTVKQARRQIVSARDRADARAGRHGFTDDQQLLRLAPYPPCRNDRKIVCRPMSRHRHGPVSIADLKPSQKPPFILLRKAVFAGWMPLNSKGGVGKSFVAFPLALYYRHLREPVLCFFADATTATFSRFAALSSISDRGA